MGMILLFACHTQQDYKQTFVREGDSSESLTLMSKRGIVRPAAEFPRNLWFKMFGTEELSGTYEMKTGTQTVNGTFTAGREGDQQWIKFEPSESKEWKATVKPGGQLVGDDEKVWEMRRVDIAAKAEQTLKSW
jgi:hypothetical protein